MAKLLPGGPADGTDLAARLAAVDRLRGGGYPLPRYVAAGWFGGRVLHRLRREPQGLRIVLKRVDLIDSEAPHRALAVPF